MHVAIVAACSGSPPQCSTSFNSQHSSQSGSLCETVPTVTQCGCGVHNVRMKLKSTVQQLVMPHYTIQYYGTSLMPRPHSFMRKSSLAHKIIELALLRLVYPCNIQNICDRPLKKMQVEMQKFITVREVLHNWGEPERAPH